MLTADELIRAMKLSNSILGCGRSGESAELVDDGCETARAGPFKSITDKETGHVTYRLVGEEGYS